MKISYVNGICVKHDAISNSIRGEIASLMKQPSADVRLFSYACDFPELPFTRVQSVSDVALNLHFQQSDLVVFHFGVYYPLFDLLTIVPTKVGKLVVFHNITPKNLLPPCEWETIDRSNGQVTACAWADHVICVSETNLEVLRAAGVKTQATVLPLSVPVLDTPSEKPSFHDDLLRLVFLGRFVRSKGPHDLLAALRNILDVWSVGRIQLDLVGNLLFSDQELLSSLRKAGAGLEKEYGGRIRINFLGNISDVEKRSVLSGADIFVLPTYHEGFCVPIVEAIASGCRVVTYENSNTPFVSGGLATLTPTGDVDELGRALLSELKRVSSHDWRQGGYRNYAFQAQAHVKQYSPQHVENRFIHFVENFMRETRRSQYTESYT
jgi:glycosyltransferase involved in cell wall biosynthesis